MRFDIQLWPQGIDWPAFRDAAVAAEAAGFEGVWTWDHLMSIYGPDDQPALEGWTALTAVAPLTSRVRLGLMVAANTFRNPGLTAKIVTTLDHISEGRAILGLGGAWFEREHAAYGIPFGDGFGDRLDRLDEAVTLIRRLLDGERFDHEGRFYRFRAALAEPRPVQARLPILIGGAGLRKTLRTVALRADGWNTSGPFDGVKVQVETLRRHCADVGRDPGEIEMTTTFPVVIRDDLGAAQRRYAELLAHNATDTAGPMDVLLGPPDVVAAGIDRYRALGFTTVIVRMVSPYDRETIDRVGEVRDALGG